MPTVAPAWVRTPSAIRCCTPDWVLRTTICTYVPLQCGQCFDALFPFVAPILTAKNPPAPAMMARRRCMFIRRLGHTITTIRVQRPANCPAFTEHLPIEASSPHIAHCSADRVYRDGVPDQRSRIYVINRDGTTRSAPVDAREHQQQRSLPFLRTAADRLYDGPRRQRRMYAMGSTDRCQST